MDFSNVRAWLRTGTRRAGWLTAAVVLASASTAVAAVPTQTAVEGYLTSVGGGPVTDGYYDITFALYKDELGGNPIYTEGPATVAVKNGMWAWQLGSKTPLQPALLGSVPSVWIAVKVGADAELPRKQLSATPFALRAALAEGLECSGCVGAGQLDPKVLEAYVKTTSLAKVATSGKFEDLTGGPDLSGYAKTSALAKVATSGAYGDLAGTPDLNVFAKLSALAKVATSGSYKDLADLPDLGVYAKAADLGAYAKAADLGAYAKTADLGAYAKTADLGAYAKTSDLGAYAKTADLGAYAKAADLGAYAKTADLAAVAKTGSFSDLSGVPTGLQPGAACGTGLVVKGIKANGALDCVSGGGKPLPGDLPPDGIDEVSNGLIYNQFDDATAGTPKVAIKDNNPVGIADTLIFPDLGIAQGLTVSVQIANSDVSTLRVSVFDPNSVEYVLCGGVDGLGKPYPACGKKGDALKTSFPAPTASASGDLTSWVGKNPKGNWILKVVDLGFLNNATDGEVTAWSVGIQTLSSKKIQVKGDAIVDGRMQVGGNMAVAGSLMVGNDTAACTAAKVGSLRYTAAKGLETCIGANWVAAVAKPVIYTGFCGSHGTGGGWNNYCLNNDVMNTASDYFSVTNASTGVITVKIPGYYRIHMNLLYNNCWNQDGVQVLKSGTRIASGYSSAYSGVWGMHVVDVTWPLAVGDTIQVQAYNSGCTGYAYHQGSAAGTWSKFTMMYAGSL